MRGFIKAHSLEILVLLVLASIVVSSYGIYQTAQLSDQIEVINDRQDDVESQFKYIPDYSSKFEDLKSDVSSLSKDISNLR